MQTTTQFGDYDGLFSPVMKQDKENGTMLKPTRTYLCGYKGGDGKNPDLYQKMFEYAETHQIELTGYAFEQGINDFMTISETEYVTEISIKAETSS